MTDSNHIALAEAQFLITGKALHFSRKSILELLKTKGFTKEEIEYAIDNLNADFRQVALKAAEYEAKETRLSKGKIHMYLEAMGFTEEEVAYAMENLTFDDFKGNALYKAKWYLDEYLCSKKLLYEKLIKRALFIKEEAAYALEYLKADFKDIALQFATKTVKQPYTFVSKHSLHEKLAGKNGYGFTEEEANYVLDHINIDYKQQALALAVECATGYNHRTKEDIYFYLTSDEESNRFTVEEAAYAIEHLDEAIAKIEKKKAEERFAQKCGKFDPDEAAYAMENLDSAEEDFGSYSPDKDESNEEQNDRNKNAGDSENSLMYDIQRNEEQQNKVNPVGGIDDEARNGEYNEEGDEEEEYDFPEPDFSNPGMIPDPQTCLDFVAKYEDLAERARDSGLDDLAEQYESAADHWRYLYEEAEDEEMEW